MYSSLQVTDSGLCKSQVSSPSTFPFPLYSLSLPKGHTFLLFVFSHLKSFGHFFCKVLRVSLTDEIYGDDSGHSIPVF